jgi:hypothetical protein
MNLRIQVYHNFNMNCVDAKFRIWDVSTPGWSSDPEPFEVENLETTFSTPCKTEGPAGFPAEPPPTIKLVWAQRGGEWENFIRSENQRVFLSFIFLCWSPFICFLFLPFLYPYCYLLSWDAHLFSINSLRWSQMIISCYSSYFPIWRRLSLISRIKVFNEVIPS